MEVMVAIVVITGGLLFVMRVYSTAKSALDRSRSLFKYSLLLEEKIFDFEERGVIEEGKERDQGVAYLDDGTMVVVEEGRRHVGQKIAATVNSILQTSAGRMVFAKAPFGRGNDRPPETSSTISPAASPAAPSPVPPQVPPSAPPSSPAPSAPPA